MHILLAVDGSSSSAHARDLVASIPWPAGTGVTLLMAYEAPVAWFPDTAMAGAWLPETEEALRVAALEGVAGLAGPLEGRGWTINRRVEPGRAASVIRSTADELGADLIVIGSRGHGPIQSMLLGSVSAEVADLAAQSVLVARHARVTQMLVASDGSECATAIPDVLDGWQGFRATPAVALSVAPIDSPAFELMVSLYTLGSEPMKGQREELLAQFRMHAEAMATRLSAIGIPAVAEVRSGDAAAEIVRTAAASGADLIVTGSRSLHGMDRLLLGSVARNVLQHAHASVLIVRQPQAAGSRRP